jgi:hypothetical protein
MNTTLVIIVILAALALLGAVAVTVLIIAPQAEAGCEKGKGVEGPAFNASKGKCFDRGSF